MNKACPKIIGKNLTVAYGDYVLLQHADFTVNQGDTRSVVYLRAQGYSYQEIAQKLQITEASARVVEHRTRAWLKATLQKEGYDE